MNGMRHMKTFFRTLIVGMLVVLMSACAGGYAGSFVAKDAENAKPTDVAIIKIDGAKEAHKLTTKIMGLRNYSDILKNVTPHGDLYSSVTVTPGGYRVQLKVYADTRQAYTEIEIAEVKAGFTYYIWSENSPNGTSVRSFVRSMETAKDTVPK
jgi:hypothetical protein